jgi:glutamate--cysteine ligase
MGEADLQAPVESVDELVDSMRAGEKPPEQWRVGTEHEKIGLHGSGHAPVPYAGAHGIGVLLERIAELGSWNRVVEGENVIALLKDGASITLEPGGQLELSGAPLRTIHETRRELDAHLELVGRASEPLGINWLALGIHPLHAVEQLPTMPKERYRIMRSYLPTRGSRALTMMFATATVQANLDYQSEADMVEKVRISLAIQPIVSAIFANSSLSEGKANGFASKRLHAWADTDPDRCGMLPIAFDPDFGYRRYVEWALDVPMFFIVRNGEYRAAHDQTFRQFLKSGRGEERATLADFDLHMTTLFPDVRVKRFIEVRGADVVAPGLLCALPALWKGVLYNAEARAAAWALIGGASQAEREHAQRDVALRGLDAAYAERPLLELARELAGIARTGLRQIAHAGPEPSDGSDETGFMDPVDEQLERGCSPAQTLLERWEGEWKRSPDRLIEYARY